MQLWGLTGGIASGKTTVATYLRTAGVPTLGADAVYHQLLQPAANAPSSLAKTLAAAFGAHLLGKDGQLNRQALGQQVFGPGVAKQLARRQLEALTHPAIYAEVARQCAALAAAGHKLAVYDVPLLFESGRAHTFAGTLVVWVPASLQLARLVARDGLAPDAARDRLQAQLSLERKRRWASWVIDNRGAPAATERQVMTWLGERRAQQAAAG